MTTVSSPDTLKAALSNVLWIGGDRLGKDVGGAGAG